MTTDLHDHQHDQLRLAGRKALGALILAILVLVMVVFGAEGDETRFLRIGTGSAGGTYSPIGEVIAEAISAPLEPADCTEDGPCGIDGLMGVARASFGAVENLENIRAGMNETGFIQSDLAYWASLGKALYTEDGPMPELRAIAGLYPEVMHIVVPADSDITSPADLTGKRVSIGPEGSGTLIDAQLMLEAYGLTKTNFQPWRLTFEAAADMMAAGEIDAFFAIGGVPIPAIADLADKMPIRILSLDDWAIKALVEDHPFFSREAVDMSEYGLPELSSVAVQAIWATTDRVPDDIVYEITRALWRQSTLDALALAHPRGKSLLPGQADHCLAIPLHAGAERFYREQGTACVDPHAGRVTN